MLKEKGFADTIRITHMNESCHTYKWVMSHVWMSHVTHMNEPCHPYEWAMLKEKGFPEALHITHMNELGHAYTGHVTRINAS